MNWVGPRTGKRSDTDTDRRVVATGPIMRGPDKEGLSGSSGLVGRDYPAPSLKAETARRLSWSSHQTTFRGECARQHPTEDERTRHRLG